MPSSVATASSPITATTTPTGLIGANGLPLAAHQNRAVEAIIDPASEPHLATVNPLIEYGTGTGKTAIIAVSSKILIGAGEMPGLIVVPNSLMEQTYDEFNGWAGEAWTERNLAVLDGSLSIDTRAQLLEDRRDNLYLLSHEALSYPRIRRALVRKRWAFVQIDEASRFRNWSKRTGTLKVLGAHAASRYAYTGNLTVRSGADCFYVMDFLDPGIFETRNRQVFVTEWCEMGGYMGTQALGIRPDRLKKFKALMDRHRIKCELRDVRDMPPRTLSVRKVDMPTRAALAYESMRKELKVAIERENDDAFESKVKTYATRLQRLQEIGAGFARNLDGDVVFLPCAKTDELAEMLTSEPDVPTVVWYWWRPELNTIRSTLDKGGIDHSILGEPNAVQRFMAGDTNVFVSQLARGGYGLNLTRAVRMIYHSLPWDLDVYSQSQERNMRLTTTADHLSIIHLVNRHSVDEYVRQKLVEKAGLSTKLSRSQALEMLQKGPR